MRFFHRKSKMSRSGLAAPSRRFVRRLPLHLERLEDRTLLSADNWIGGSGNWDVGSNWSLGNAPGSGDTAVINTSSAATIAIQSSDAIQVQSVTTGSNDTLSFTGGSLTVTSGASKLSGALSMSGGSVTASGSGVSLTANGSTAIADASLYALAGATLSLPKLTDFSGSNLELGSNGTSATIQGKVISLPADGTSGAVINVPSLPGGTITLANAGTLTSTTFNVGQGTNVVLTGGTYLGTTTCNVSQGATVDLGSGTTYGGTLTGSGSGTVAISYSNFRDYIANGGLTLNFPDNMFQWTGGTIDAGKGNLTNRGTITLSGEDYKDFYNDGVLDNFGAIIQTSGMLVLGTDGTFPTILKNEAGASYLIESDYGITQVGESNNRNGNPSIINAGIIRKTAGSGTSELITPLGYLSNTGVIEADSGTLLLSPSAYAQISGTTLTGGTWNALNGASLLFSAASNLPPTFGFLTVNDSNFTLSGGGADGKASASIFSATLTNNGSLTFTNGADSLVAPITNLTNNGNLTVGGGSTFTIAGNFTQTAAGTLNDQIDSTLGGGQVAVTGTATLGGNLNANLPDGFAPPRNAVYPVMTYKSVSGTFAKVTGLGSKLTEQLKATSLDLQNGVGVPVDLELSQVTAPTTATTGQQITVNWQVSNAGSTAATASWQDSVYLSTTPTITGSSVLLGSVTHSGGLAAGGSYNASLTAAVPALPPGDYYVLVLTDSLDQVPVINRAKDILAAGTGQLTVTVPALTLGKPTQGTFTAADQDQYYQVTVPAGGTLQIALTSAAGSGAVALYVSPFTEPTPYSYQYVANVPNQPSQTVLVPSVPNQTTYYILAQSISGAAATAGFTLTASQTNALTVLPPATSYSAGNGGTITIPISGTNFSASTTASLSLNGKTIGASSIYYQSDSEIYATFDLQGAATGNYALTVTSGAQTVTAPTTVQVVPAVNTSNPLQLVLTPPAEVRAGRDSFVTVSVTNVSNNDILAPLLQLTADGATLKLPSQSEFQGDSLYFLATSPTGPAGTLTPGESVNVTIQFQSTTTNPTINFQLNQADDSQPMDWASQEQALQIPTIPDAAWPIVFANFEAAMGSTVASYHAVLAADATYLAQVGEPTYDVKQLVEFEVEKANAAYTPQPLNSVTADALPAPGMDLTFSQSYHLASISGRYFQGLLGGQGWTTNWDISAKATPNGDVAIQFSGSSLYFFLQPDGSYLPESEGEGEVLTLTNGAYRLVEPNGTIYQFNANGALDYVKDANGNQITASYNSNGQLVQLTDSNGEYLKLGYNAQGQMTNLTDSNGQKETYGYTGQFLTSYSDVHGTTNYSYVTGGTAAQDGSLSEIAYANNTHVFFTYDTQGRLIDQHSDGDGGDEQLSYLTSGGIVTTDGDGNKTTTLFDLYGATVEVIDALGNVTRYKYDANLNLVQVVAPGGFSYSYSYDANGNPTSETDPLGHTRTFTYNANNYLTSFTDAKGNTTSYAYDSNNNLLSTNYANGTVQQYSYNPLGEATQFVNANGQAISYTYNAQGLVATETFADGTSYSFTHNARGNLTSATDAQGSVTKFVYGDTNNPDLLTEVEYPDGTWLKFTYNVVGQRTQSVDNTGFTVNYSYDALGRLSELTDGNGKLIVQYIYDNAGSLMQKDNGNGTFTVYTYDGDGKVLSITNYAPSTGSKPYVPADSSVNSFDNYTYDPRGNVLTDTSQDGEWAYQYDADSQLTSGVFTPNSTDPDKLTAQKLQYVYDAVGNRVSETVNGVTTTYVVNNVNEYTTSTTNGVTTTYQYDTDGNLIAQTTGTSATTYTYNELNELTGVSGPGLSANYAYDPLGKMVSQTVNGATTNYQIDPAGVGNAVATFSGSGVYDNSGGLTAHFTYGLGLVSQVSPAGAAAYYDFNITGDTIGVTNAAGKYISRYAYLPFGQTITVGASVADPFTFAGKFGVIQAVSGT